jgi:hypothetical protein
VATVAGLQARAGGGEGSAPILLAGYDPVLVTLGSGRRMNSGTQGKHRDGPPTQPAGTGSDALVREGNGGEIASSVPAEAGVQTGHGGIWIGMSVPAEVRVRAQSAYEKAYTRAYRAYLGASPAAGEPTASPLSAGGSSRDCNYPCPLIFPTDTPQPADTCCSCPAPSPCDSCGCEDPLRFDTCRCREFPYVVFEPLREECVDEDCTCGENGNCICTGRKCTAILVPR